MKKKHYFATSLTMWIGLSLLILYSYGIFLLICFYWNNDNLSTTSWAECIFFTIILPTIIPFTNAQRFFTVVTLDKNKVTQKLFGIFRIRLIKWNEISEIRIVSYIGGWVFFSKHPLENIFYDDIVKRKDVIQIAYTEKLINAIREYTDIKIIGYDDFEKPDNNA